MLDFGGVATMPVKETPTKAQSKPDDCLTQRSTPKRSPVDMKDALLKGCPPGIGDGDELMLEVTCGQNQAALYMSRLQLGSKGTCVLFENAWLTPNEFQYISGRETAKDWKRSIKHHGKSLKVLISKGILTTSPLRCNCGQCAQIKDKDVSKYIANDEAKLASAAPLRDAFTTELTKLSKPDITKNPTEQRFFRYPSESNENKKDATCESSAKQQRSSGAEQCLTSLSQGGARYASSCDNGVYGSISDSSSSFRYDKPSVNDGGYQLMGHGHLANNEQHKLSPEESDAKLKTKKKLDGNENEELAKELSRAAQNGDQRPGNEGNKNEVAESVAQNALGPKRSVSSGSKPVSGAVKAWSQNSTNYRVEQPYHSETTGAKPSPHDKTKKGATTSQLMPSCMAEKPSCSQVSPSGKNSMTNSTGCAPDPTRLPTSDSSFMFPSFGSPYYPMIPTPQLPAYYPNPYMWPMPFPTNPSTCSYGWTAPSEMTAPNCLRSPAKDALECSMANGDQAFNFPWMKRQNYSAVDLQSIRDATNDSSIASGKRKLDCDPSEYFPPSKHPFYLSDSLRPTYGDSIGWPGYNPSAAAAAALDFRFLPYNIPSYIPDIRPSHGLFASNFLKGSENSTTSGLGLYPGLFPSQCLGVNSR